MTVTPPSKTELPRSRIRQDENKDEGEDESEDEDEGETKARRNSNFFFDVETCIFLIGVLS